MHDFRRLFALSVVVTLCGLSCNSQPEPEPGPHRARNENVAIPQGDISKKNTTTPQGGLPETSAEADEKPDLSVVLGRKFGNVENGSAYDKAFIELGKYTKVILPEDASVRHDGEQKKLQIYMKKRLGFAGHPPEPMSIKQARKYMGCAVQAEKMALVVATYGEWDSHIEGGASMKLLFIVPKGVLIEKRPKLSGEDSVGRTWNGAYLTKPVEVREGYWYGPASPGEGWMAVTAVPDSARRAQ